MSEEESDALPQHIIAMFAGTVAMVMAIIAVFDLTMYFYDTFSAPLETLILIGEAAVIFTVGVLAWKHGDKAKEARQDD